MSTPLDSAKRRPQDGNTRSKPPQIEAALYRDIMPYRRLSCTIDGVDSRAGFSPGSSSEGLLV